MFNPVLFPASAADDRVNRDGNCCHQREGGRADSRGMVAIVAGVETWISSPGKPARCRFNWPAAITLILSVSAIPVLLAISSAQSPTTYARHSLDRLGVVAPGSLSSPGALFVFVASNVAHWLGSNVVRQWLWIMIVGTFGTILLRPYYLVIGVPTTVVAWLMNRNDLLWAPRFFSTEALLWCITLVGFASIARAVPNSQQMDADRGAYDRNCNRSVGSICATRPSCRGLPARRTFFVRPAFTRHQSDERLTRCSRATAEKVSRRNRLLPQLCFSATRMTETSSG